MAVSTLPPRQYFIREPDNQTAIQGEQVKITYFTYQYGAATKRCILQRRILFLGKPILFRS
jgi:hypothetical protein